jgi:flagellar motor switch protein FliM
VADVLDQSEVDALLAAVDGGQTGHAPAVNVFGSRSGRTAPLDVQVYDFKRPERVSKDQMRALEGLHEGFGRNFGAALSGYLRTIVEVSVAHIEQLTYSEFIHSLPNPTCFNLLKVERAAEVGPPRPGDSNAQTLDGQLCLEISPLIVYPVIDRLLGGSNADLFIPQRPLTQIEQRLVQKITDRAMQHLSDAWSNLTPVTFSVSDFESNPQLVLIVPPNETVVVIGFELKMGNRAGTMSLCIPYNVMEPIMGVLAAQNWFSYQRKGGQEDHLRRLTRNVGNSKVDVRTFLAQTTIKLNDLMSLQLGDVITTDKPVGNDVLIQVEGKNKFLGQIGQLRGNRSIRITRMCQDATEAAKSPPDTPGPNDKLGAA